MRQILTSFGVWFPYDVLLDSRYNFLQFLLEQNQQKLQISLCSINALLDISILLFDYAGRKALLAILSKFAQPLLQTCLKTLALRNEYALALLRAQLLLFGKGTEKFDLLNIISPAGPSILNQIANKTMLVAHEYLEWLIFSATMPKAKNQSWRASVIYKLLCNFCKNQKVTTQSDRIQKYILYLNIFH